MRLKRHGYGVAAKFPGAAHNFAQNVRVGAVYAIKVAHTHDRGPDPGWNILELLKDLHELRKSTRLPRYAAVISRKRPANLNFKL